MHYISQFKIVDDRSAHRIFDCVSMKDFAEGFFKYGRLFFLNHFATNHKHSLIANEFITRKNKIMYKRIDAF